MGSNRVWASIAGAALILFALTMAFRSDDTLSWVWEVAMAVAIMLGFVGLSRWPKGSTFVLGRPRSFVAGGIAFAVIGFGACLTGALSTLNLSDAGVSLAVGAACACLLLGIFVAFLPRTLKRIQAVPIERAAIRPDAKPGAGYHPLREAVVAWRSVLNGWLVLLRISGVWLLLQLLALVLLGYSADHLDHDQGRAALVLLCLAALVIGSLYVVLPTIAVWWFKWLLTGDQPGLPIALPTKGVFSLAWRLWLFMSLLGTAESALGKQVQDLIGGEAGRTVAAAISYAALPFAIALASSFALRFPAIAVQDAIFTRTAALVQGRRMWPGLPLALLLSITPFLVLGVAVQLGLEAIVGSGPHHPILGPIQFAEIAIQWTLLIAALASGASLLSKAYLRAKSTM